MHAGDTVTGDHDTAHYPPGQYLVHLNGSSADPGMVQECTFLLVARVSNESASWSSLKALYR